ETRLINLHGSFHESKRSDGSDARIFSSPTRADVAKQSTLGDYTQGHMTMDPDSMAAAAQQLEAIQAAIAAANAGQPLGDQATLEQMAANGSKNDDFSAYFAAVAAGAASEGLNGMGLNGMGGDMGDMGDMGDSQGSDKPLTSKYRWSKG
ncbi:hypothetical protein HaLaN_16508, partial [Haematococcus lacustris]